MEGYSQGLKFKRCALGGGYAVAEIGDCTDTDIRIPPVTPEGAPVIRIGSCAFMGRDHITSVTIP